MSIQNFPLPDVGEGLTEAEILAWHVAVGDKLAVNQVFVEIETAKAAVELPSPFAGRVHQLLAQPGDTVAVGSPIISVETESGPAADIGNENDGRAAVDAAASIGSEAGARIGESTPDGRIATLVGFVAPETSSRRRRRVAAAEPAATVASSAAAAPPQPAERPPGPLAAAPQPAQRPGSPLAAPPVRKLAKDLGIDLGAVAPGRSDGVITREDVQAYADAVRPTPISQARQLGDADRERRVPIRGVRKATAQAMVASAFSAPHVTEFLSVDMTATIELRDRMRTRPEFADVRLTPLAFVARAVCIAAARTPEVNSSWDGDAGEIVYKGYVNLGIAADTPRGLVVPVLRDADRMNLFQLAGALADLTATARAGHTGLADLSGGTITITNIGVLGVDTGTPILNPGESAILAVGSIKDAPWVVDGQLAVRKVGQLALSFDHRVVDGAAGSRFLADVGALLSDPGLALAW